MSRSSILFTAGQFAKMHNINKRTLHYYDEIGLFSPEKTGDNKYRYYSYLQSPSLEMILTLRELNMSIEEIAHFMNNRSSGALKNIIQSKTDEINSSIQSLKKIRTLLNKKQQDINLCDEHDLSEIDIVEKPAEYLLLSNSITGDYDENDFAVLMEHTKEMKEHRLLSGSYGCMLSAKQILLKNFDAYNCFFSKLEKKVDCERLFIKPKGNYIRAFCKGDWDKLPETYTRITAFAKQNGLKLTGYAFEEGINELAISCMEDYITHIEIMCEAL